MLSLSETNRAICQTKKKQASNQPSMAMSSTATRRPEGAGRFPPDRDIRRAKERHDRQRLDETDGGEGPARAGRHQRPGAKERRDDADDGDQRLARADLMAAMLGIAENGEISVVGEIVEDFADRGDDEQREQCDADAVDLGEQRILQGDAERADDQHRLQAHRLARAASPASAESGR